MASGKQRGVVLQHALSERGNDLYETPPEAVHALLAAETLPRRIWEPACGPGSIARTLRAAGYRVVASDLVDYQSPDQDAAGVDFLFPFLDFDARDPGAIVSNPPYKHAAEFVALSLQRARMVAMLLRLAFLESERRRAILDEAPLAAVHVFRNRLPMMHRDGWTGPRASSSVAFAWFVWRRDHVGPAVLNRISWEPAK